MPKITAICNTIKQIEDTSKLVDAYIIPLKKFSINYQNTFTTDDIRQIINLKKEIFVSINKNFHNDELENLTKVLKELEKINIKGIIFYDIAVLNLVKTLNLKLNLVWSQEHLVTNFGTINYWYNKGAKYAYLSSELNKREINEIKANTKAELFLNIFGYIPMFTSQRHLVNNYLESFNIKDNKKQKTIHKEGKNYLITDTKEGTTVYSNYILNATLEDFEKIDYLVFNSNFIDEKKFKKVLENYHKKEKNEFETNLGFLYEETIYKVK